MTQEQEKELRRLYKKLVKIDPNCVGWEELKEYVEEDGYEYTKKELIDAINCEGNYA